MIGDALKQLFVSLGRYASHHARRTLGLATAAADGAPGSPAGDGENAGLDGRYVQPVDWPSYRSDAAPDEMASLPLYQIWNTIPGGQKSSHFFAIYERIFGPLRAKPQRILEIGVYQGGSLELWKRYFAHPSTLIVGIDILPECARFDRPAAGVHVRIGSQADGEFLKRIVQEFGPFDLIIDDGSHRPSHMIASFNHLYADGLADHGIYLAEDVHANYWRGWRDSRKTFLDICMEMADYMHDHYRTVSAEDFFTEKPSDQRFASVAVARLTTMIEEIRIFDSIVAIYKARRAHVPYLVRRDSRVMPEA